MYICRTNEGASNECCYGRDGYLIVGPPGGGSVGKVSTVGSTRLNYLSNSIKHQFEDILPYIFCCKGTQTSCNIYKDILQIMEQLTLLQYLVSMYHINKYYRIWLTDNKHDCQCGFNL